TVRMVETHRSWRHLERSHQILGAQHPAEQGAQGLPPHTLHMAAELRQHFIRVAVRNRTEVSLVELLILAAPNALHNELRVPVVLLERAANLHDVICLEESGNLFGTVHTRPWISPVLSPSVLSRKYVHIIAGP